MLGEMSDYFKYEFENMDDNNKYTFHVIYKKP